MKYDCSASSLSETLCALYYILQAATSAELLVRGNTLIAALCMVAEMHKHI